MLRKASVFIIFLFYYTSYGQIVQVPASNLTSNPKKKLSLKEDNDGPIKTLRAKRPVIDHMPSQWAPEPEGSPRWQEGIIYYYVDHESYDIHERIREILDGITRRGYKFCPKFKRLFKKPSEVAKKGSWLHFTNPDRVRPCVHEPGRDYNGEIKVVLGYDCLKPREILHTVLHGLGFRDEVTHPQRDLYVRIMWENIQPAFRSMFRIQSVETHDASLMEYDPKSIMHFHDRAYTINGQATITPMIEPSDQLSPLDRMKLRAMFNHECKKRRVKSIIEFNCAQWHDKLRVENGDNVEGSNCPYVNNGNNGDNQIVVPGNDVKFDKEDGGSDGSLEDTLVVPGNDVKLDEANGIASGLGDEDKTVVPGNSVKKLADGRLTKVIEGKKEELQIPDEEAVIVGYDK